MRAARASPEASSATWCWVFFLMGLPVRPDRGRAAPWCVRASRGALLCWRGLGGALLSGLAYAIVLWAMTRAPVGRGRRAARNVRGLRRAGRGVAPQGGPRRAASCERAHRSCGVVVLKL
jgi:hypothetical protein